MNKNKVKFLKIENLKLAIGDEINDDVVILFILYFLVWFCVIKYINLFGCLLIVLFYIYNNKELCRSNERIVIVKLFTNKGRLSLTVSRKNRIPPYD